MRYFKQISSDEIKLPSITGAGLLTLEEVKSGEAYIKKPVFHLGPPYWYLRTPGEDEGTVFVMKGASIDDAVKINFDDESNEWMFDLDLTGCGNRPALYFSSSLSEVGANLGDKFEVGELSFTIITDNIALCDSYISVEYYYVESYIKKNIDTWFENDIKPFLS